MDIYVKYAATTVAIAALLSGCVSGPTAAPRDPQPTAPQPSESQAERLADAQAALDAGAYDSALSLFQSIIAENPTITTAYMGVGDTRMAMEDYHRAEPAYARAARLEPRNYDAQYSHGQALYLLERYVEAVRAFHRALTIEPDAVDANVSIATTYLEMDEPDSAVVFAERSVLLDPDNGTARANLGAAYEDLGRWAEAIDAYLVAIELVDEPAGVMMNLVNCLSKERRYQETVNAAENLIRVEPSPNAYERLGWARFKLGRFEESMEAYTAATDMDANHWPSLNGIGVNALNSWLLSGKTDGDQARIARDAFRRSLRANADQQEVIRLMTHYDLR